MSIFQRVLQFYNLYFIVFRTIIITERLNRHDAVSDARRIPCQDTLNGGML